jgi:hypothetical protein
MAAALLPIFIDLLCITCTDYLDLVQSFIHKTGLVVLFTIHTIRESITKGSALFT